MSTNDTSNSVPIKNYDLEIKRHYDTVAETEKDAASSTMADMYVRENETMFIQSQITNYISNHLHFKSSTSYSIGKRIDNIPPHILDVGCGNGYTLQALSLKFPEFILQGIEFNDSLRKIANTRFAESKIEVNKGDIRVQNSLPKENVDILICQRVLINLLDQNDQKIALNNIIGSVKPGGLLLFIECFESGLNNLNSAREEFNLEKLAPAHHNLYLHDDFFQHPSLKVLDLSHSEMFSSHYFISRVLHQSFLNSTNQKFQRNSHFVSFFTQAFSKSIVKYSPLKPMAFTKITK